MRAALTMMTLLATAYACGGSGHDDFSDPIGAGARGGSSGGVGNAGGTSSAGTGAETSGGTSGTSSGGGGPNGGTTSGGSSGTAGKPTDGGAGPVGDAGAGGDGDPGTAGAGGSAPTDDCPGETTGCVIDWAGTFGTVASASMDGVGQAAVFGDGDANTTLRAITGDGTYLYVSGSNCVRRIEIATATVQTIAGVCGSPGYVNDVGSDARFNFVDGLATDGDRLWVADSGNNRIRAVDLINFDVNVLSGGGSAGDNDGWSGASQYDGLRGMVLLGGNLYVVEEGNASVRRISTSNGTSSTIAGNNNNTGDVNGAGNIAEFEGPRKIATDGTDLFVGDTENHLVRRVVLGGGTASSNTVSTFAGYDVDDPNLPGHKDGPAAEALFNGPRGVTFDGTDLIVADSDNCVIRKIRVADGEVITMAGSVVAPCANHVVGIGMAAEFNKPTDIHYDPGSGDLFILENSVIRRMYYK